MKIEVDLNDILGDEDYGTETLQESIRRQVIDKLSLQAKEGIGKKIDYELAVAIKQMIETNIKVIMPQTILELMESEYVPVDRYGDRSKSATTFRKELVKQIQEEIKYKKTAYSSDRNAFTKAVDDLVKDQVNSFKLEFSTKVNEIFVKEAFEYAKDSLFKKLGVKP